MSPEFRYLLQRASPSAQSCARDWQTPLLAIDRPTHWPGHIAACTPGHACASGGLREVVSWTGLHGPAVEFGCLFTSFHTIILAAPDITSRTSPLSWKVDAGRKMKN